MGSPILAITDESMLAHRNPPGHPERPARLESVLARLEEGDLPATCCETRAADRMTLERVHTPAYLDRLDSSRDSTVQLDPDTWLVPGSVDAAERAAGGVVLAVEHALRGDGPAFALVRPPGHHAEPDRALGFCLLANVAIAVEHALATCGARRVMVVDYDVHHGNGTQHAFETRDDVLVIDAHRGDGFWPGSGDASERGLGRGTGYTVNLPYPAGTGDEDLLPRLRAVVTEHAERFRPDLLVVSVGFDAHEADPLGGCRVTDAGFAALAALMRETAARFAADHLALALEGGYDPATIARGVAATINAVSA